MTRRGGALRGKETRGTHLKVIQHFHMRAGLQHLQHLFCYWPLIAHASSSSSF
jgi:hypothetical protein